MALLASVHATPLSLISVSKHNSLVVKTRTCYKRLTLNSSSLSSSSPSSTDSNINVSSTKVPSSNKPPPDKLVNYAVSSSGGSPVARFLRSTESNIERVSNKNLCGVIFMFILCVILIRFLCVIPNIVQNYVSDT